MLQEVKEPLKKRWEIPAGKTRNVKNPAAGKSVNLNCGKDNQNGENNGWNDHKERGHAAKETILPLVLSLCGIYAKPDTYKDGQNGCQGQKLNGSQEL